jgi:SAM-dependent methyltransferase
MTTRADQAVSFGSATYDYDRYRIGPPPEIVDLLIPTPGEAVLDLAAGTGAMTRQLVGRIPTVFAVDPDRRMRDVLAEKCPGVTVLEGTAERIPLPDASVDAVVVASAWHWVDPELAIPEIVRVLRSAGTLGITWSRRDRSVPWVADLEAFRHSVTNTQDWIEDRVRYYLEEPWLPVGSPLADVEVASIPWTANLTRDEIVGLLTTYNGYLDAPAERKPELLKEFSRYVHDDARLGGQGQGQGQGQETVPVPMLTHYWRARLS